jgi:3-hydroxybutyrate dehydrogenase
MGGRTLVLGSAAGIGNASARPPAAGGDRRALGDIDAAAVNTLAQEDGATAFHVAATDNAALQEFAANGGE